MSRTPKPPLPARTRTFARELRSTATDAESLIWYQLRAKRFQGYKWRRQHPLPPYIVDFYCHSVRVVIELDGGQHTKEGDAVRTAFLEKQGCEVLRFWDNDVFCQTEAVLDAIYEVLQARSRSPGPSPDGRGER